MNNAPHELTMDTERNEYFKIISQLIERIVYLDDMAEYHKNEAGDFEADFLAAEDARLDLQKKLDDQKTLDNINELRIDALKKKLKRRNEDVEMLVMTHDADMITIRGIQSFVVDHRIELISSLTPSDYCEMLAILRFDHTEEDTDLDTGEEDPELDPWAIPDEDFFEDDDEDDDKDGGFF